MIGTRTNPVHFEDGITLESASRSLQDCVNVHGRRIYGLFNDVEFYAEPGDDIAHIKHRYWGATAFDAGSFDQGKDAVKPSSLLDEANELINGQRAADYGSATENFGRIARRWSDHLGIEVTPEQVILCMIDLKMARLAKSPGHRDSWLDVAGYVGCFGKLEDGD